MQDKNRKDRQRQRSKGNLFILLTQATFLKRKKGLLKKSMELSILCQKDLVLCIFDKNQYTFYSSNPQIPNLYEKCLVKDIKTESFSNKDVFIPITISTQISSPMTI